MKKSLLIISLFAAMGAGIFFANTAPPEPPCTPAMCPPITNTLAMNNTIRCAINCLQSQIDTLTGGGGNKVDSVTRIQGTDSVVYWINGLGHFGFIDSVSQATIAAAAWSIYGNSNIDTAINFFGTLDANDIAFKVNSLRKWTMEHTQGAWTYSSDGLVDTLVALIQEEHFDANNGYDFLAFKNHHTGYTYGWQEEGGIYFNRPGYAPAGINASVYIENAGGYPYEVSLNGSVPTIYFGGSLGTIKSATGGLVVDNTGIPTMFTNIGQNFIVGGDGYTGAAGKYSGLGGYNGSSWSANVKVVNDTLANVQMLVPTEADTAGWGICNCRVWRNSITGVLAVK